LKFWEKKALLSLSGLGATKDNTFLQLIAVKQPLSLWLGCYLAYSFSWQSFGSQA
jgi:hypothetical protein